ncbi:protein-glutamate O-methyltransferase CheR [Bdellovibrio bacteriovorus]|uniref:CheR family methyltransferase n=1 Tax=Bdellovibrio bacteriovorus TaxID=959 RepID=UPI0035A6D31D
MAEAAKKLEGAALTRLLSLVKTHTGITMEERKRDMLTARIKPRLRILGLESMEDYIDHLEQGKVEIQDFVNLVTTNETHFFRTQAVWDYFQNEYLPEWYKKNPDTILRIWSAAASTGEEAHSLGMACEEFRFKHPSFKYKVMGSDIDTEVLAKARSGVFRDRTLDELKNRHPALVEKYFREQADGTFRISPVISANLEFFQHNLHKAPPKGLMFDIVFLRNVLIYFNDQDQELVLSNMHRALKSEGMLILGESESLARHKAQFTFKKPLIYMRG